MHSLLRAGKRLLTPESTETQGCDRARTKDGERKMANLASVFCLLFSSIIIEHLSLPITMLSTQCISVISVDFFISFNIVRIKQHRIVNNVAIELMTF